jgi:hypothetical protein
MTTVHIDVGNPGKIYANLNIAPQHQVANHKFTELLKAELYFVLSRHGVKLITVTIQKRLDNFELYNIVLSDIKNDWQEEKIREECDITYISFVKKENLLNLKED